MDGLQEVDKLTVINIVDNEIDWLSSPCARCCNPLEPCVQYKPELAAHIPRHKGTVSFMDLCCGGHGLSLLLGAEAQGQQHTCLFDAGPDPTLWLSNAEKLGVELADIDAVVLSHYHVDHSGGLRAAIPGICASRQAANLSPVLVDLHPDWPDSRGVRLPSGAVAVMQPENPSPEELGRDGADVKVSKHGHCVLDGFFFVSGEVPRLTPYEAGFPGQCRLVSGEWQEDPELMDERYMVVKVRGAGLVVFSACSHAGIINVCRDALTAAGEGSKLLAAVGGFHLVGVEGEKRIRKTVHDLLAMDPQLVVAGHCTGWRAKAALAEAFPEQFQPCVVGGTYVFQAPKAVSAK